MPRKPLMSALASRVTMTPLLASFVILQMLGCGSQPTTTEVDPPGNSSDIEICAMNDIAKVDDPVEPEPEFDPPLDVASWTEIQEKIAAQKGKVVVVDLWSTTCEPCIRELPGLVKLQEKFPDEVVCMSVNLDYTGAAAETPESHQDKVERILTVRKMGFPNFISSTSDFDVYDTIKLASIPAVMIYDLTADDPIDDAALSPVKRFDNDLNQFGDEGFSYEQHITPLVEQLLDSKDN